MSDELQRLRLRVTSLEASVAVLQELVAELLKPKKRRKT